MVHEVWRASDCYSSDFTYVCIICTYVSIFINFIFTFCIVTEFICNLMVSFWRKTESKIYFFITNRVLVQIESLYLKHFIFMRKTLYKNLSIESFHRKFFFKYIFPFHKNNVELLSVVRRNCFIFFKRNQSTLNIAKTFFQHLAEKLVRHSVDKKCFYDDEAQKLAHHSGRLLSGKMLFRKKLPISKIMAIFIVTPARLLLTLFCYYLYLFRMIIIIFFLFRLAVEQTQRYRIFLILATAFSF